MTTTKEIDKEAVRLLAIQIGVRPAARKLGLNEDTVCSWAKRDDWFAVPGKTKMDVQAMQARPGDVLLNVLAEDERATRASLSKYARRASEEAENMPGVLAIAASDKVHNVAKTASIVHRWEAKEQAQGNVVVNIALLGVDPSTVTAEHSITLDCET